LAKNAPSEPAIYEAGAHSVKRSKRRT